MTKKKRAKKLCAHTPKSWKQQALGTYLPDDLTCARCGVMLQQCNGEAHSNAYIDHCGVCLPGWGWVRAPSEAMLELRTADARLAQYVRSCINPDPVFYEILDSLNRAAVALARQEES